MSDLGEKTYEDVKNDESLQSDVNLKQLIKEIDEIKDTTTKDDDKIEGVFAETSEGQVIETSLNQSLIDSLSNLDSGTFDIIFREIKKISENQNLNLSEDVKQSVENLLSVFTQFINNNQNLKEDILSSVMNEYQSDKNNVRESENNQVFEAGNSLTSRQTENVRIIKDELGINVSSEDIDVIKDTKLTHNQIENIRNIKKQMDEIGITITVRDIDYIKDMKELKLTQEDVNNIQKLKSELGIDISVSYVNRIKDLKLTSEQVDNINNIQNLGIKISAWNINEMRHLKLTPEQVDNIKNIQNLGIDISAGSIDMIKNLKLTPEQVDNIKNIQSLGIDVSSGSIYMNMIEDIKLTPEQVDNIKNIQSLGISVSSSNIDEIKNLKLTPEQVVNIKNLKSELGIYISAGDVNRIKDLKLTSEQVDNIKNIQNLGISVSSWNINDIKDLKLIPEQMDNIKNIQNLGISVFAWDVNKIKDLKLTSEQVDNIKDLRNALGIDVSADDISEIKDLKLTPEQVDNIKNIQNLGINVSAWNINEIKDLKLTSEQVDNIKDLRNALGIDLYIGDIKMVKDMELTKNQIKNINIIKDELGIWVGYESIKYIKDINLNNEVIDNIRKIQNLGIELSIWDVEPILNNPDILVVNSDNFYEGYDYTQEEIQSHYYYKRGRIIENIQSYVQNLISENRDIGKAEVLESIRSDLITLPIEERIKILGGINKVVNKFNTVRKYLDFEKGLYKTPKELLCAMRGITDQNMIDKITDDITVIQHGVGLTFFVGDETSYQIIEDISLMDSGRRSGGFNTEVSEINDLVGTLSVVNGKDPGENESNYTYGTVWHEGQHNRNSYFMGDKEEIPITRAKDEITAYLRNEITSYLRNEIIAYLGDENKNMPNLECVLIEHILTQPASEGGLYQYELEGEERENHKKQVKEILGYVNDLIELAKDPNTGLTRDKVISMLSDTPREKWKDLHSNIMKAVEVYGNEPILDKFWRSGTAEKQTEIDEIMFANSIEEIKCILNDPKYSHILRVPNNKGGLEISAIIDDVVSGKLDITFIPIEIRSQVQKFINQ